jgi:DNA polymerase bacteriophage-type
VREFVSVDFETRSTIDLRRSGVYPYAKHKNTDIWCVAYLMPSDTDPRVWRPGDPVDAELVEWITAGHAMRAWNANFERVIWNEIMVGRYGWPETTIEQWFCTAADARAMALPGQLGDAARALGVDHQKDNEGKNLMLRMARPRKVNEDGSLEWWAVPERISRLIAYCRQDVLAELDVHHEVRALSATERAVFELDQRINDRGIRFDRELATAAREVAQIALKKANVRLRDVTKGAVHSVAAVGQLVAWLRERGVDTDSVTKQAVRDMKAQDLPDDVREVLTIREELGKSSVAKIESMFEAACPDDRIRGLLMYHGAATGRWSGRLVQPQNFPRGTVDDPEQFIPLVLDRAVDQIDLEHPVLDVISSMLRCMLTASPGRKLVAADFSAIEARVLAWLAGERDLLATFADGGDVYKVMASKIYSKPVSSIEKTERQMGKMAILGLGYGMGAKKFVDACKTMANIEVTADESKQVVDLYRTSNAAIVSLWKELEAAALKAVLEPGTRQMAAQGRIRFMCKGGYLWMRLPSGRLLCYSNPKAVERVTPWGSTSQAVRVWGVSSYTRRWEPYDLYSGLLAENAVQAIARDVLVEAMLRADNSGYSVVLSVHDEIVTEVPEDFGSVKELEDLMSIVPKWAEGLPLSSEGWQNFRFRK